MVSSTCGGFCQPRDLRSDAAGQRLRLATGALCHVMHPGVAHAAHRRQRGASHHQHAIVVPRLRPGRNESLQVGQTAIGAVQPRQGNMGAIHPAHALQALAL